MKSKKTKEAFMKKKIIALLLLSAVLVSLVSCMNVSASELSKGFEKQETDIKAAHNAKFYNDFALTLLNGANDKGKNTLVSPYSAAVALALLTSGADGESLKQIEEAFGITADALDKEAAYLMNSLKTSKDCKIKTANSLWIKEDFKSSVKEAYLQKNADLFGAQIYAAPFDQTTVSDVNNWCNKQTDGMIKKILENFGGNDVLLGINALLFDAKWEEKYEKSEIKNRDFHNYDGTVTTKEFLCREEKSLYGEGYVGFYKEYKGGDYCFTAIMPDDGTDIYEFLSTLDGEKLQSIWDGKTGEKCSVKIPEFTFDGEADLKKIMQSKGVTDIFNENANLSKITDDPLYITDFKQKTRIEFDRNGTKAAAITFFFGAGNAMPPAEVLFDHPFIFTITDTSNGMPIFIGIVADLNN